ncbi:MAG TPA: NDP-sugar synthase [Mycobacteriales bacterium]|nr:NDP-sugar synthase [Mycobacteriales bacterium]
MSLEAVVLVGGKGTRLRPLTIDTPKPMLPLAGVPFLTHQLARARAAGVEHVVLATSYRPEVFEAHFGDGADLGLRLEYVTEVEPLGTGGGIRNVAGRLESDPDDPVLILNGDILSGHDIAAQLELHRSSGAAVTLHLVEVADPRAFGCVPTDAAGRVAAFLEKMPDPVTTQVNAGCYVFARRVIDAIPTGRPVSVERDTFPGLLAAGEVVTGYLDSSYWLDVGTPAAFVQGSADVVRGLLASPALPGTTGESLVLGGAAVDPSAVLSGGTVVGPGARIEAEAQVQGSIIAAGAVVGPGTTIVDSIVAPHASIGGRCSLRQVVVADRARLGERVELTAGARVWPDIELPDVAIRFSSDA